MKILKITSTALIAFILTSCKKEAAKTEKNTDSLAVKKKVLSLFLKFTKNCTEFTQESFLAKEKSTT